MSFFDLLTAILSGRSPRGMLLPTGVIPHLLGNKIRLLSIVFSDWHCAARENRHRFKTRTVKRGRIMVFLSFIKKSIRSGELSATFQMAVFKQYFL
jgi:hypothetical protein